MTDNLKYIPPLAETDVRQLENADNMTLREHRELLDRIHARVDYIVRRVHKMQNVSLSWWLYNTADEAMEEAGTFDYDEYRDNVGITAESNQWHRGTRSGQKFVFLNSFPIEFLWMNFEPAVQAEVIAVAERAAAQEAAAKQRVVDHAAELAKMRDQITDKLTPDELRYIDFRKEPKLLSRQEQKALRRALHKSVKVLP